jgi:hypothetical protein
MAFVAKPIVTISFNSKALSTSLETRAKRFSPEQGKSPSSDTKQGSRGGTKLEAR